MTQNWPWVALAVLGASHGLNPAMGWLFALALGLQEKRHSAILGALVPIALGHAVAITLSILVLRFVQHFLPMNILKWASLQFSSPSVCIDCFARAIRGVPACELEEWICFSGLSSWHLPTAPA